jgi:hypothetical protein
MLVVLDRLMPAERLAFTVHDMFAQLERSRHVTFTGAVSSYQ